MKSRLGVPVLVLLHACLCGASFFEFTPWGSAFVLNSRLWAGVLSFQVTLGGSGVWFFEITPRRDVKKRH